MKSIVMHVHDVLIHASTMEEHDKLLREAVGSKKRALRLTKTSVCLVLKH